MTLKLKTSMFENTNWYFGLLNCLVTKILFSTLSLPLLSAQYLAHGDIHRVIPSCGFLPGVLCLTTCTFLLAHDTGLVTLQVAFNNQIISNSVVFEYKARALPTLPSSQHDWLSLDGKKHVIFLKKAGQIQDCE